VDHRFEWTLWINVSAPAGSRTLVLRAFSSRCTDCDFVQTFQHGADRFYNRRGQYSFTVSVKCSQAERIPCEYVLTCQQKKFP
jgi:hypothetical protein